MKRRTKIIIGLIGAFALMFPVHPDYSSPPTVSKGFFDQKVVPRKNEMPASYHQIEGRHRATIKVAVLSGFKGRSVFGASSFLGRYFEYSLGPASIPVWFPCDHNGNVWITEDNIDAVMKNIQVTEQDAPSQ